VNESIRPLLRVSRDSIVRLQKTEYALVSSLQRDPLLAERIKQLRTVPGVGPITAASTSTRWICLLRCLESGVRITLSAELFSSITCRSMKSGRSCKKRRAKFAVAILLKLEISGF